jgi:phosphohistidine phosphatase
MISDIHSMKTLIVVRHAKSSWAEPGTDDIDRPLNDRGKKDAPEMAKRLHKRDINIDLFLSSPALRARTTAQFFAGEYKAGKKEIALEKKLYNATAEDIYKVLATLDDKHGTVAVFGHNPGITDFVNTLSQVHIDDMPTCAVYAVTIDTNMWTSFKEAGKQFLFFDYPKNPQER